MIARAIFRSAHPAIPFLLLLAIADDALGLMILAVFYPTGPLSLVTLAVLMTASVLLSHVAENAATSAASGPTCSAPGALSWAALYFGGFHPALALVPVIPFMPHCAQDLGMFDAREDSKDDTLNRFEHWWAIPVQFILLFFGLANAGVPLADVGPGTYFVLAGLLVGKPLGVVFFSWAARTVRAHVSRPVSTPRTWCVVGMIAAIGFTVSLFFATAAFPPGSLLAETKMGALLSFSAAGLAPLAAWLIGVGRFRRQGSPADA